MDRIVNFGMTVLALAVAGLGGLTWVQHNQIAELRSELSESQHADVEFGAWLQEIEGRQAELHAIATSTTSPDEDSVQQDLVGLRTDLDDLRGDVFGSVQFLQTPNQTDLEGRVTGLERCVEEIDDVLNGWSDFLFSC